jgi:hypothetical protein
VADVFRHFGPAFRDRHGASLSVARWRAMTAIESCRTAALGGHVERCGDCGHQRIAYNSCRNRNCPKCQGLARAQDEYSLAIMEHLIDGIYLRRFFGGAVLRGEGFERPETGKFNFGLSVTPFEGTVGRDKLSLLCPSNVGIGKSSGLDLADLVLDRLTEGADAAVGERACHVRFCRKVVCRTCTLCVTDASCVLHRSQRCVHRWPVLHIGAGR